MALRPLKLAPAAIKSQKKGIIGKLKIFIYLVNFAERLIAMNAYQKLGRILKIILLERDVEIFVCLVTKSSSLEM